MYKWLKLLFITAYHCVCIDSSFLFSQSACTEFLIDSIIVTGNEKTKEKIILFESGLLKGEKIPVNEFLPRIEKAEANLKRTGLFSGAHVTYLLAIDSTCKMEVKISLIENWLLFPTVLLETVDRNFNVWWNEFNHDLSRINYGLGFSHNNLTGLRDRLKGKFARGYSDKYEAAYYRSYLGKKKNIDAHIELSYIESREAAYKLEDSRLKFFSETGQNTQKRMYFNYGISFRKDRENRWAFKNTFEQYRVLDTLAKLNPDYLLDGSSRQLFTQLILNRNFNNLNHGIQANAGWNIDLTTRVLLLNTGIIHRYWNFNLYIEKANRLFKNFRHESILQSQVSFIRNKMPFNLYNGIGTGETRINGYELYQISGMDFILTRQSIYYRIFDYQRKLFKIFSDEPRIKMQISTEAVIRIGAGFVNDPYYSQLNSLANTTLGSISAGLQFGLNGILKLEMNYSVNHRYEKGLYFYTSRLF